MPREVREELKGLSVSISSASVLESTPGLESIRFSHAAISSLGASTALERTSSTATGAASAKWKTESMERIQKAIIYRRIWSDVTLIR
jgi:hypothetical protein